MTLRRGDGLALDQAVQALARPVRFEDYCSLVASWISESDAA